MKKEEIIVELVRIAERLGIKIIEDKLLRKGGHCRVFTIKYIIMDKRISTNDKIELLVSALKSQNLDDIYLTPKIRELCTLEKQN